MSCTVYGHAKGGGFLVDFASLLFLFSLSSSVMGDSDTLPDHNVFLVSFRPASLVCPSAVLLDNLALGLLFSFLFLSLMQSSQRIGRKETRKTTQTHSSWNIPISKTTTLFFFLEQAKRPITDHSIRYIDKYLSITHLVHELTRNSSHASKRPKHLPSKSLS